MNFLKSILSALRRAFTVPSAKKQQLAAQADAEIDSLFAHNQPDQLRGKVKDWIAAQGGVLGMAVVLLAGPEIDKAFDQADGDADKLKASVKSAVHRALGV